MRYFLHCSRPSSGGRNLIRALNGRKIKTHGSAFRGTPRNTVINWGDTEVYNDRINDASQVLNHPTESNLRNVVDKRAFFQLMEGSDLTPPAVYSLEDAREQMTPRRRGRWHRTVCRTVLNSHSGRGIVIADSPDELVQAPLYTKYIKKAEEFRVHVVGDIVCDMQRKARRRDVPDEQVNWRVRSHANGFIYAREGMEGHPLADRLEEAALAAIDTSGLDFGAVDIIYNHEGNSLYVLEINTAPGLEGTTVDKYAQAFHRLVEN